MVLNKEIVDISNDVLKEVKNYGVEVELCVQSDNQATGNESNDVYNDFYGQVNTGSIEYTKVFGVNSLVTYEPVYDKRKGSGFDENCDLGITIVFKQLLDIGYITDISELSSKVKRKTLLRLNNIEYTISTVNMQSVYNGIPIVILLSCNKLVKSD